MTNQTSSQKEQVGIGTSGASAWESEYARGGIPSSVREEPSSSVVSFLDFAKRNCIVDGLAIDVGCGGGRNSLHLAVLGFQVLAMDFTPSRIEQVRRLARELQVDGKVKALVQDVRKSWPADVASAGLIVDAFCFKHQIEPEAVTAYADNAARAARDGALLMLSFAGVDDGYYAQFPAPNQLGPGVVIVDPGNGIASRLYDPQSLAGLFRSFDLVETITKRTRNVMHGREFDRETHVAYLRRRPRSKRVLC